VPQEDTDAVATASGPIVGRDSGRDRDGAPRREKEEFGGVKVGCAFFGWLTATGTAVILTAIAAALGAATGSVNISDVTDQVTRNPQASALVGIVVLALIVFVSYFCGGYVAGRMARFSGLKQGVAVWSWGLVVSLLATGLAFVAGDRFNIVGQVNGFPQLPPIGDFGGPALIVVLVAAAIALVGAILGGLAGMRFHRRVDRAGLAR
jgi:hypothetical protein